MSAHRDKADLALRPARTSGNDLYASGATASQSSICQGAKAKLIGDNLLRERPCRSRRLIPTSPILRPPIPY
jgi:hypothetical protein